MVDILTVIHENYCLLDLQVRHWASMEGDHRLLVADNTKIKKQLNSVAHYFPLAANCDFDGESHGAALDFLVRQATSDVIGIIDSDFFWLRPDIVPFAEDLIRGGMACVGCEGWYDDWEIVNRRHPTRAGHLAPVCWGMFLPRELAAAHTFVVTRDEGRDIRETGWRLREHLITKKEPVTVFRAFKLPLDSHSDAFIRETADTSWFFGDGGSPYGVHLVKGSGTRADRAFAMDYVVRRGMDAFRCGRRV